MKLVKGLLMSVVGAIILLHTLIPHEHFESSSEVASLHSHECSTNLFEDIQISFGLDHGSGHFEHFVEYDQVNSDLILAQETDAIDIPVEFVGSSAVRNISLSISEILFERHRGPPA